MKDSIEQSIVCECANGDVVIIERQVHVCKLQNHHSTMIIVVSLRT